MRKFKVRLLVALSTFAIGISIAMLWSIKHRGITTNVPAPALKAADLEVKPPSYDGWRKVIVKGRFSFYIPQYLNDGGQSLSSRGAVGEFRRGNFVMEGLFHLYYHSHKEVPCSDETPSRYKATTVSEVVIGGKSARIITEIPAIEEVMCIHDMPQIQVCFPDIGRGQKLYMRLASGDAQGLEIAKQIINSIEFQ